MSRYGATVTVLATGLVEATVKDEAEGFDIGAGLFGENQSEWLRHTAEAISGEKRPAPEPWGAQPLCACKGNPKYLAACGDYVASTGKCSFEGLCERQTAPIVEAPLPLFCSGRLGTENCGNRAADGRCTSAITCECQVPF